ncbi:hypothetical protein PVAG01_10738 [Phlyctema vagabunda]|uniref:Uncharacterized protein n=1 Tax=Phlyctema vagabunda TaxID=108571 RepID=A0ABR4P352_9HELO
MNMGTMDVASIEATTIILWQYKKVTDQSLTKPERLLFQSLPQYDVLINAIYVSIKQAMGLNINEGPLSEQDSQALYHAYFNTVRFNNESSYILNEDERSFLRNQNTKNDEFKYRLQAMDLVTKYKDAANLDFPPCRDVNPWVLHNQIKRLCNPKISSEAAVAKRAESLLNRHRMIFELLDGRQNSSRRLIEQPLRDHGKYYFRPVDYLAMAFCLPPSNAPYTTLANVLCNADSHIAMHQELPMDEIKARIQRLYHIQDEQLEERCRQIDIGQFDSQFRDLADAHTRARGPSNTFPSDFSSSHRWSPSQSITVQRQQPPAGPSSRSTEHRNFALTGYQHAGTSRPSAAQVASQPQWELTPPMEMGVTYQSPAAQVIYQSQWESTPAMETVVPYQPPQGWHTPPFRGLQVHQDTRGRSMALSGQQVPLYPMGTYSKPSNLVQRTLPGLDQQRRTSQPMPPPAPSWPTEQQRVSVPSQNLPVPTQSPAVDTQRTLGATQASQSSGSSRTHAPAWQTATSWRKP